MKPEVAQLQREIVSNLKAENWSVVLPQLESWCELFPGNASAWLNRGYCLARLGRFKEAVGILDRALEIDPDSKPARDWRDKAQSELDRKKPDLETKAINTKVEGVVGEAGRRREARFAEDQSEPQKSNQSGDSGTVAQSFATLAGTVIESDWSAGSIVDSRYEIRSLEKGGMGTVAIAFDRELQRMVAVKTPLAAVFSTPDGRARFYREAEAWVALGIHPNICCAYYVQEFGGLPRLFIEYVDGGDLRELLKAENTPDFEQRLDIAIQIASGLDYTHNFLWTDEEGVEHRGILHRDIKPANVLMTTDGVARVTDFGLVRAVTEDDPELKEERPIVIEELPKGKYQESSLVSGSWQTVTEAGGLVGTPPYMAPELWKWGRGGSVASDIYAFGCVLYEVFCGRRPYFVEADTSTRTQEAQLKVWMRRHLRDNPPDPIKLSPGLDLRLAELMVECLAKDSANRPQTFASLRSRMIDIYEDVIGETYSRPEPQRTRLLADSLNNRGVSFAALANSERAISSFREALEADPAHLEASFNLGLFEWRSLGLADAELERRLVEAHRNSGDSVRGELLKARLLLHLDDIQGALKVLSGLPVAEAQKIDVRREIGLASLALARETNNQEKFSESRDILAEIVAENSSDVACSVGLAAAFSGLGDKEQAREEWKRICQFVPDTAGSLATAAATIVPGHCSSGTMLHQSPLQCVVVTPNRSLIARAADGSAVVWDLADLKVLRSIDLGGPARPGPSIAIAGNALAASIEGRPLTLFDLVGEASPYELRPHPGFAISLVSSPDGKTLISGGSDRQLRVWEVESRECVSLLDGHEAFVSEIVWHPSGRWILSASADSTVRVWDLAGVRSAKTLNGSAGPIHALAVDPSGQIVVSGGQTGLLEVWDLEACRRIRVLKGHHGPVSTVKVVSDRVVTGGEDRTVRLWDLANGNSLRVIRLPQQVRSLAISGDSLLVAHGSSVSVFEMSLLSSSRLPLILSESAASSELGEREKLFRTQLDIAQSLVDEGQFEDAIEPIRRAREVPGYQQNEKAVELWNRVLSIFPKRALRSVVEARLFETDSSNLGTCSFGTEGSTVVAGDADGGISVFDAESGDETDKIVAHEKRITCLAVSSDGSRVFSASQDQTVRAWDILTGEMLRTVKGHESSVQAVAVSPDDHYGVSVAEDGCLFCWRTEDDEPAELLGRSAEAVSSVAISADGRFVASAGWDQQVTVWSFDKRAELRRLVGHEGAVNSVAFSPDCRLIASASDDGTVRLWDYENEQCWRILSGHTGSVKAIAFSPDARFLLSGGRDSTLRLWDLRTGTPVRAVEGHAGPISDVTFRSDGRAALSAGSDGSVRFWTLDWEPELPERRLWDDRVQPFLEVFLSRVEASASDKKNLEISEVEMDNLLEDLTLRGFGWLAPERVRREVEKLARGRVESRDHKQRQTQDLVARRRRQERIAPTKQILGVLIQNLGLKIAVAISLVILGLLAVMSLRVPESEEAEFHRTLHRDVVLMVRERDSRLHNGKVLAFQGKPKAGPGDCLSEDFSQYLEFALFPEKEPAGQADPTIRAEDVEFREAYARSIDCLGEFSDPRVVDPIFDRVSEDLHPYRLEDLLSVLVRVGPRSESRIVQALNDQSPTVRHFAALALVHSNNERMAQMLVNALEGDDFRKVEAASYVLTELIIEKSIPEAEAFPAVRQLCRSIDPRSRRNGVRSLVLFEHSGPARLVLEEVMADSDAEVAETARQVRETLRNVHLQKLFGTGVF